MNGSNMIFFFLLLNNPWVLGWNESQEGEAVARVAPPPPDYLGSCRVPGAAFIGLHLRRMVVDLPELQD